MFVGASVTDIELPGALHNRKCLKSVALMVCLEPCEKERKKSVF